MPSSAMADMHSPVQANMCTGRRLFLALNSGVDCLLAAAVFH